MNHKLKTAPEHFQNVMHGSKTFECRKNDRDYRLGDVLILEEWNDGYTGQIVVVKVSHILYDYQFKGIAEGFCIMSIEKL